MSIPLEISFHRMQPSSAVEAYIREKATKLERFYDHTTSCQVVVEPPHSHHHKGRLYRVRIRLLVPGNQLVVSREHHDNHAHEDLYVAIRDAFDALRRKLEDFARRQRGNVKTHQDFRRAAESVITAEASV